MAGSSPLRVDPAVVEAAGRLRRADAGVEITLVVPQGYGALQGHGAAGPGPLPATSALTGPDGVRGERLASVRVGAKAVRDGAADIWVATGPAGPAAMAAGFSFGLVRGATTPVTAWLVPTDTGPMILAAGSAVDDPVPALLGKVLATALLGLEGPRVAFLGDAGVLVTGGATDVAVTSLPTAVAALQVLAATGRPTAPALQLGLTGLTVFDPVGGATAGVLLDLAVLAVRGGVRAAVGPALGRLVDGRRAAAGLGDGAQSSM